MELIEKIDKTIETVCEEVQEGKNAPGELAEMVKALAELIEARAKLR